MFGIPRGPRASAPGLLVSGLPTLGCGWETLRGLPTTHLGASPVGTPCPVPAQFPQSQPSRDARSQAQPPWCLLTAITSPVTPSPAPKAPPSWSILSQADPVGTTGYQGRWVGGPEHHLVEGAGGGWQRIISGLEVTHHCVYFFFLNKRLEKEKKKTTQTIHNEMQSQNQKALQRCDGCSSAVVPCPTSGLVWGHPKPGGFCWGEKGHTQHCPPPPAPQTHGRTTAGTLGASLGFDAYQSTKHFGDKCCGFGALPSPTLPTSAARSKRG